MSFTPNGGPNDTRLRRGLIGLVEAGKPPQKPIEVLTATYEGSNHIVKKQTGAACVNGIDKWWIETSCGLKLVVPAGAKDKHVPSCIVCIAEG